jgi:branched-chain amino acid transport system permease protein
VNPQVVAQQLVFGLFVGGNYGLAAVGLSLVFGVLRVLNVAHGELLMLGGYLSFWAFTLLHVDPFVSALICGPALLLLGLALNWGLFSWVERLDEENKIKNSLLISFGLTLVIQNVAQLLWTADDRSVNISYGGAGALLAGVVVPYARLATLLLGLLVILALDQLLRRTYFGKAVRATAEDWQAASLAGINVQRTYLLTFGVGAALAGIAGAFVSVSASITPLVGTTWMLKALVVVVLAGMGSIFGSFAAGVLLGLAEALSVFVIGASYREVVGLVLFLLVLLLRPQGLFGKALR